MELGEGREGHAETPVETSWGLELERTEGPWHLDLFVVVNLLEAKVWMGTPETCPHANPRGRLAAGHPVPGPWCVVSARRSWKAAFGQLPTGRSGSERTWPPHPAGCLGGGPVGGSCPAPRPRLSGDSRAVTALSGAPGFFCPARRAPGPAGREQGMGVGCLERRGGLLGARAGKARSEPVGMCKNLSSFWE